jgi:hypothetical protein
MVRSKQRTLCLTGLLMVILFGGILSACSGALTTIPSTQQPVSAVNLPGTTLENPTAQTTPPLGASPTVSPTLLPTDTQAAALEPTDTATLAPLPTPTFNPASWRSLPIIPPASDTVRQIYARGQELGNNPRAFSKIGDCETAAQWFLGDYDLKPDQYSLGPYTDLQPVIQQFAGSFNRISLASRIGFNAASVLNPIWTDTQQCRPDETPLACEYRVERPSFAFILLGTNDVYHPTTFEANLRKIIEFSIQQGVIPILATKASNLEGDHSLNITIARLAYEYKLPLWNFWLAVQPLPSAGLQPDHEHLTWAPNFFDAAANLKSGWAMRNLTALQTLNAVWQGAAGK